MLTLVEFKVLEYVQSHGYRPQKELAAYAEVSVGTVNAVVKSLRQRNLLTENGITMGGLRELEPYRVDNAIILAAGMSTRFVPFSYEKPKGLTVVKGEVLIERQIRQLKEAGVNEIVLVLGHMMEKFLYLIEKYNVKVVVNNDYQYKNTHSSIYYARDYLKSSYICCADNCFPVSVFHKYEYRSIYSTLYMEGTWRGERGVTTDKNGLIIATQRPAVDQWVMNGYAFFTNDFSIKFKQILEGMWNDPGSENLYWEQVYAEHVKELPLYAVRYTGKQVLEFDSVAELEQFDPEYIKNNEIGMTRNICSAFNCSVSDIHNIKPLEKGYTNKSFSFEYNEKKYIYRTPGHASAEWIDRKCEKKSLEIAKELGIDASYICADEDAGWKISHFVDTTESFSFSNEHHLHLLCNSLKTLYSSKQTCGKQKNYLLDAKHLLHKLQSIDEESYKVASAALPAIEEIDRQIKNDGWPTQLVHNDIYEDNLLISGEKLYLIDWEYAGDSDIGYDLCKLFVKNNAVAHEIDYWLSFYYGRNPTAEERKHIVGCAAIAFYYWYIWAVYMVKNGNNFSDLMLQYLTISNRYQAEFEALI